MIVLAGMEMVADVAEVEGRAFGPRVLKFVNFGKEGGSEDLVEIGLHRCRNCRRGRMSAEWFL